MDLNSLIMVILAGLVCVLVGVMVWMLAASGRQKAEFAKLALVADKTENAVFVTDAEGKIDWVNEGFTRMSGFASEDLCGKMPGAALLGTLPNSKAIQKIREGMSSGKPFAMELLCSHKSGHRYWMAMNLSPVFDKNEQLTHFIGIGSDITSRKHTEEELVRVCHRNELLLNAAEEGIFGLDVQGNITFVNPAAARITGWEPASLIGRSASAILHQLKLDKLPSALEDQFTATAFKDRSVLIGDVDQFRRSDGSFFPVEYTSNPIREGNNVLGSVVLFHDATDRKQGEVMRARQGRQFALRAEIGFGLAGSGSLQSILQRCAQAIVKNLDGALARIWTLNAEENVLELQVNAGILTEIDNAHSRIPVGKMDAGKVAKEGVARLSSDFLNDVDASDLDWAKREKLVGFVGFPLLVENRLVGVVALYSRNTLPSDAFELLGAVSDSIAQGIVRKRAEEKVTEQAALLDKAQDAILVTDLSNRIIYWNKSAERLYGWPAKEVYGKCANDLIYRDNSYFERAKKEVMEKGEWKGESCQVTRGDESVVVGSQWTLVQDDTGAPKSILIVNTDLSEQKKIEAQFLRTQRMESIGTLAGGIAHDLNNVLAPIMMSVEILKEKFKDPQSQRMLSLVESSAKRGADMVKQVLTFARGVEGERVLLQTRHLVKEVGKIVSDTFPKSIQLRTNFGDNIWPIMGDATQLHQVMLNLAVNARDAMPEGGIVTLSAENTIIEANGKIPDGAKPGFYVLIKVADNGTGIPPEILDKIFDPFFTTKEMGKGTGLGLATTVGIVKSHGGFIQVQTEVNKGTAFLIYLPAMEGAQSQVGETGKRQMPSGHGELILAVDDEASVLTMTKETLEAFGYRVITARDGTEAVAAYTAHRGEIRGVLTDMLMPFMDGPATIRVLKKLDPNIRIIAASGLMDNDKVKDSTGMDNIAFLMKPYTAETLLNTVHKTFVN